MPSDYTSSPDWGLSILTIVAGENLGAQYTLSEDETSIGRGADTTLTLADVAASRQHALILRDGDRYRLKDLGSRNGTLLNGVRTDTAWLQEGDVVTVGKTGLRFSRAPSWDDAPPPSATMQPTLIERPAPVIPSGPLPPTQASPIISDAPPPPPPPPAPEASSRAPEPSEAADDPRTRALPTASVSRTPAAPPPEPSFSPAMSLDEALAPPPAPLLDEEAGWPAPIVAVRDESWSIRVDEVLSARHPDLADLVAQLSGLAWARGRLVGAHVHGEFIEFIDSERGDHDRIELPRVIPRGSRAAVELQIEAVMAARDYRGEFLLAFGAGAAIEGQYVMRMRLGAGDLDLWVTEARWLYESLLALPGFATSTLNVEGTAWIRGAGGSPHMVRFCQRGNGRPRGDARPLSATVEIPQTALLGYLERCRKNPEAKSSSDDLVSLRRYDLGKERSVPYGFSDAVGLPDGRMLYVAIAERSPEAGVSGPNMGTVLGVIDRDGSARQAPLCEGDGTPTTCKVAAITVDDEARVWAALHASEARSARLARLRLEGLSLR